MLKKILHIALFLCLALAATAQYLQGNLQGGPPAPGPRTRTPLNALERAANNLEGVTTLTDTFGNLRLALYVHVEDTCINYRPATTGNTQNLSAFVKKCSTDSIWYIDFSGRSIFLGEALTIQQIVDSIAADTSLQYNWYTTDDTTSSLGRTAFVRRSAFWRGLDTLGIIRFTMRPLLFRGSQGSFYNDSLVFDFINFDEIEEYSLRHVIFMADTGIIISTEGDVPRSINFRTDTVNWNSAVDLNLQIHNLLTPQTYFFADSSKVVSLGQFPSFPSLNYDGREKGFYYAPEGDGILLMNGNGTTDNYGYVTLSETSLDYDAVSTSGDQYGGDYSFGTASFSLNPFNSTNGNFVGTNGFVGADEVEIRMLGNSTASFGDTTSFVQIYQTTQGGRNYRYVAMGERPQSGGNAKGNVVYLGKGTTVATDPRIYSENLAFGVQKVVPGSFPQFFFDYLKIDLESDDTTLNTVSLYGRSYYFANDRPSPTLGDTSFHYWAGNGTTTNPGFITLAQVQAGVPNWYNSNGTTTDNTRIATVTETATWLSADVTADGVYPFRFQLAGVSPNEPEMMVWDFPAGDSLTLSQSDQEIVFFSNNFLASRTNESYTVQADSFQYNPNLGGTAFKVGRHNVVTQNAETGTPTHRDAIEYRTITGTAQTELFLDGSSAVWVVPTNAATNFKIHVSAICSDAGNGVGISTGDSWASWHLGGIKRVGSTTSLIGSVQTPATAQSDAGMSTSVVTIDADDTDESLRVRFTPPSTAGSTTVIRVIATLEITQTSY